MVIRSRALLLVSFIFAHNSDAQLSSYEYKLALSPSAFNAEQEKASVDAYFVAMQQALTLHTNLVVKGHLKEVRSRLVSYFDTPGSCLLHQHDYILRERKNNKLAKGSYSFKYRHQDKGSVEKVNIQSRAQSAKYKFERDSLFSKGKLQSVYSKSIKFQPAQAIANINQLNQHIAGLNVGILDNAQQNLRPVSGIQIQERVYTGYKIDFGPVSGKVSLTLWYIKGASLRIQPVFAEASFSISNKKSKVSEKVLQRAQLAIQALATVTSWNAANTISKTSFVYTYQPSFCSLK